MSGAKEIRTKIKSIKNTQKITGAMEMVAASKMRIAQERMEHSRPYAHKIYNVIKHVAESHSEHNHPYLQEREVKRVGYIVVTTDRGLCGGLNINLFKKILNHMKPFYDQDIAVDLCVIGKKGQSFFSRSGANIVAAADGLGDKPKTEELIGVVRAMLDAYDEQKIDRLFVAFNEFENTMKQNPRVQQLLPLPHSDEKELDHYWDYIYEPDNRELLEGLLTRYIESEVYQAVIENIACQQAATMVAMKSATDNAGDLINEFQLAYNKARQAAITQEISEIVSGAAAV